jgi:hypothetical protein
MQLRTKLTLGLGFLFIIIFAIAFFSAFYIGSLSRDAGNILKDNYDSIVYSKNMFSSLEDMTVSVNESIFNPGHSKFTGYYNELFEKARLEFDKNLKLESGNITEIHEKEYVDALSSDYAIYAGICDRIKEGRGSGTVYFNEFLPAYEKIRQSVNNINDVNMQAVVRKSALTIGDSLKIINYMAVIGAVCLILAFAYFWYFPFYISNSISYLSKRMMGLLKTRGIEADVKTSDELYIILQSINLLEDSLANKNKE